MDEKTREWIDNATLVELLRKWRFAPAGDPMFTGETGKMTDDNTEVFSEEDLSRKN